MDINYEEIERAKQIVKDTIGKDSNFNIDDLCLFLKKYYNAKIFDSLQELNDYYNLGKITDIEQRVDYFAFNIVKTTYKVADIRGEDYFYKQHPVNGYTPSPICEVFFSYNKKKEILDIFIDDAMLKDAICIDLFIIDGEQKLKDMVAKLEYEREHPQDISVLFND